MATVTPQKCACPDCVCIVDVKDAVKRDERNYCSESCETGHPNGAGCEHSGCACAG